MINVSFSLSVTEYINRVVWVNLLQKLLKFGPLVLYAHHTYSYDKCDILFQALHSFPLPSNLIFKFSGFWALEKQSRN